MNKYFTEFLTMKALDTKLSLVEQCEETQQAAQQKVIVKNVCTPIFLTLDAQLEKICGTLGISKARFIALAIESSVQEAGALMNSIDITEYLRGVEISSQEVA